jgi:hypothetical protein
VGRRRERKIWGRQVRGGEESIGHMKVWGEEGSVRHRARMCGNQQEGADRCGVERGRKKGAGRCMWRGP